INELDEIQETMRLDVDSLIEHSDDALELTTHLELARRSLIVANVVSHYTFVDELLGSAVARYYFPRRGFMALWRTKRFRRFNYFMLEKLSTIEKVNHLRDIRALPSNVVDYVQPLNALRNALTHTFFPENLRGKRTQWKGQDIFSI